jgi:ribosomal protein S18 acetylase RimI-like enzyme
VILSKEHNIIRLIEHQDWDFHNNDKHLYLNGQEIVGSFVIEYDQGYTKLQSLYIQPKFRGQGLFHKLMKDVLEIPSKELFLFVRKDAWVIDQYKKYGFEYHSEKDEDFDWMVRKITTKID